VVFSDVSGSKLRPVLFLFSEGEDLTILKITSHYAHDKFTIELIPDLENNVKHTSYIKLKDITNFHNSLFLKSLGHISDLQKQEIRDKLATFFSQL
jgi:hypothetical protein